MYLIGKKAPKVNAQAVIRGNRIVDNFSLADLEGKYTILFFYPLDFTFVCPTELHAFQEKYSEFQELNAELVGCSRDSCYTHLAWLNTSKKEGGINGITYPLLSDMNLDIARDYGVLNTEKGLSFRGVYLMDREGIIRHILINDLPLGRNIDEILRLLRALQNFEEKGEVCPANWNNKEGNQSFKPNKEGLKRHLSSIVS